MPVTHEQVGIDALLERVSFDNGIIHHVQNPQMKTNVLDWIKSAQRHDVIESSDGETSYVCDAGKPQDYSSNASYFAAHTDGLYYETPPQFGLLYCLNAGSAPAPTFFIDTTRIVKKLSREAPEALAVLRRLDQVYIGRGGREHPRPLIEANPLGGEDVMNITLGRAYVRPSRTLGEAPHQRETANAMYQLFSYLEEATTLVHEWAPGDLLAWDNHRFIHGRGDASQSKGRLLVRAWLSPKIAPHRTFDVSNAVVWS